MGTKPVWFAPRHFERAMNRALFGVAVLLIGSQVKGQEPQTPKNNDPALRDHLRIIEEKRSAVRPIELRAKASYKTGDYALAELECRKALRLYEEIEPGFGRKMLPLLADILLERGKYSDAVAVLTERLTPPRPNVQISKRMDILAELVIALIHVGNSLAVPPAVQEMVEKAESGKRCDWAWNELSKLRFGGNSNWEALAFCLRSSDFCDERDRNRFILKAAELAPNNAGVCLMYGEALRRQYRWREAKAQLLKAANASGKCAERAKWVLKQGAVRPPNIP